MKQQLLGSSNEAWEADQNAEEIGLFSRPKMAQF
jgi:hypothetical protein